MAIRRWKCAPNLVNTARWNYFPIALPQLPMSPKNKLFISPMAQPPVGNVGIAVEEFVTNPLGYNNHCPLKAHQRHLLQRTIQ